MMQSITSLTKQTEYSRRININLKVKHGERFNSSRIICSPALLYDEMLMGGFISSFELWN